MRRIHIGTAGWGVPRSTVDAFPGEGTHLQRYAGMLNCTEINSSFYRSHQAETYSRWASQTPREFRFSVKVPRAITHEGRLRAARAPLESFIAQASGLEARLAVVLVQLPPSLEFEPRPARTFFGLLCGMFGGAVVCEPRHAGWFEPSPRTYWSNYDHAWLRLRASELRRWPAAADCWCMFDNTASGAAASNALAFREILRGH